jgi:hypothetical protein
LARRLNQGWETAASPRAVNLAHMGSWAAVFLVLLGTGFVGRPGDLLRVPEEPHPGNSIVFWKRAVADGKADAARKLVMVAGSQAIGANSPEAYNELGLLSLQGTAGSGFRGDHPEVRGALVRSRARRVARCTPPRTSCRCSCS